jgi:hypothetical protein
MRFALPTAVWSCCLRSSITGYRHLTIHSSRTRFAGRLNSGVRPRKSDWRGWLSALRGFSSAGPHWPPPWIARAAARSSRPPCNPAAHTVASGIQVWRSGLPAPASLALHRPTSRGSRRLGTLRPNNSFKPNPLRGFGLVSYQLVPPRLPGSPAAGRLNSGVRPQLECMGL